MLVLVNNDRETTSARALDIVAAVLAFERPAELVLLHALCDSSADIKLKTEMAKQLGLKHIYVFSPTTSNTNAADPLTTYITTQEFRELCDKHINIVSL